MYTLRGIYSENNIRDTITFARKQNSLDTYKFPKTGDVVIELVISITQNNKVLDYEPFEQE